MNQYNFYKEMMSWFLRVSHMAKINLVLNIGLILKMINVAKSKPIWVKMVYSETLAYSLGSKPFL